jgi:transposase
VDADGIYGRDDLPIRLLAAFNILVEIVQRLAGAVGFHVLPQRWKAERTFAWLSRNRRLGCDCERNPSVSETMIHVAMTKLMLKRLCPG